MTDGSWQQGGGRYRKRIFIHAVLRGDDDTHAKSGNEVTEAANIGSSKRQSVLHTLLGLAMYLLLAILCVKAWLGHSPQIRREVGAGNDQLESGWTKNASFWLQSADFAANITYGSTTGLDLMAIDNSTGLILWNRHSATEFGITALQNSWPFVFAVTATDAHAYQASTGATVWSTHLGDGHVAIYFQVDGHRLRVYYGDRLIELAAESGKVIRDQPSGDIQWIQGNLEIHLSPPTVGSAMTGIDSSTGEQIWSSPGPSFLRQEDFPIQVVGETLLVMTSSRGICSLSLTSGEYQWCRGEEYVSDLGINVDRNFGYAVDKEFELTKIDLGTGRILARTQFLPKELPASMRNIGYPYTLSLTKHNLVVSFGDSDQTFGLKLLEYQSP